MAINSKYKESALWKQAILVLIVLIVVSCSKDAQPVQITGKWTGTMSIWKRITFNNGVVSSEGSDTTNWNTPGYALSLEFSGDTVTLHYVKPNHTIDNHGLKYVFEAGKLKFFNNPFSYHSGDPYFGLYQTPPFPLRDVCSVTELTPNKLVLYDQDTINRNPLVVWQQRHTFVK